MANADFNPKQTGTPGGFDAGSYRAKAQPEEAVRLTPAQQKTVKGVRGTTIVLKTKLLKNGKIRLTWTKSKDYKLDYLEVYRSTKKNSGYGKKPFFTTKDGSTAKYLNTKNREIETENKNRSGNPCYQGSHSCLLSCYSALTSAMVRPVAPAISSKLMPDFFNFFPLYAPVLSTSYIGLIAAFPKLFAPFFAPFHIFSNLPVSFSFARS